MRFLHVIIAALLALTCALTPARAAKRVALVIGNDRYVNLPNQQLRKAVGDARAVGAALSQIGFDVISGENVGRSGLVDKLDELMRRLAPGDTAFFFFSGHGVALDGANYILPTDVPDIAADQETRLKLAALGEADIIAGLTAREVGVAVVVLDACRNNPFKPARPGLKGVGFGKGLAPPPQVRGVFSLYAAGIGQGALDQLYEGDPNPNSVFSRVLVPALTRPGVDLTGLAVDVRQGVARIAHDAGAEQLPAYYDGLTGRFYLAALPPGGEQPKGPGQEPVQSDAERVWGAIKNTTSLAAIDDYIRQYGNVPVFGTLARERREQVAREQAKSQIAAIAVPPAGVSPPAVAPPPVRSGAPLTAAQERTLKPQDSFKECADCPEMVVVPAGSFSMGSPAGEKGREANEGPQHDVTIGRQFAVGRFHVTVDQFAAFVREARYAAGSKCSKWAGGGGMGSWRDPGLIQEGSHPVVCVSFGDAKAYVNWIAKKTGKPYRLLSEAEFEYAARGQTSPGEYPRFWFGNDESDLCRNANGSDQTERNNLQAAKNSAVAPCSDGYVYTSPAGRFTPNAFGLFDMAGNAWQWTEDCWHDTYTGAPSDGSAWTTTCDGSIRVVRGGSWRYFPRSLRAAWRFKNTDISYFVDLGFRVARTLLP